MLTLDILEQRLFQIPYFDTCFIFQNISHDKVEKNAIYHVKNTLLLMLFSECT
jgi:hypothetical protein